MVPRSISMAGNTSEQQVREVAMSALLSVGTAGMSVWFSRDLGETWDRPYVESGLYSEARVWALASDPAGPGRLIAGTDSGLYRFDAATDLWTHLPSPL